MKKIAVLFISLLITGFASAESKQGKAEEAWRATLPEANADFGPIPNNYEELITKYYADRLKDPDSAKYSDFIGPRQNYRILSLKERSAQYGYTVCLQINAKNSYGGYTGKKLAWTFIRDNTIVDSAIEDSSDVFEKIKILGALKRGDCKS